MCVKCTCVAEGRRFTASAADRGRRATVQRKLNCSDLARKRVVKSAKVWLVRTREKRSSVMPLVPLTSFRSQQPALAATPTRRAAAVATRSLLRRGKSKRSNTTTQRNCPRKYAVMDTKHAYCIRLFSQFLSASNRANFVRI